MLAPHIARFGGVFVAVVLFAAMFAPLVAIHLYSSSDLPGAAVAGGEVTVGIAVILRATARRLLRGASSNLMRTTAGALGRTATRAMTRRFVKFAGRIFVSSMVREADEARDDEGRAQEAEVSRPSQVVSLGLGFVGLCASFGGVLYVADRDVVSGVMDSAGITLIEVILLAGVPLLAYAAIQRFLGPLFGVRAFYRTEIDGLLLQAYFTGAGSFLPLTTDVEYVGDERGKRRMAIWSILSLFLVHLVLYFAAQWTGSAHLEFLGSLFLIYCFVYVFPIKPLEGYFIWASSKLTWLLITLPILYAFLNSLPPIFGEIL